MSRPIGVEIDFEFLRKRFPEEMKEMEDSAKNDQYYESYFYCQAIKSDPHSPADLGAPFDYERLQTAIKKIQQLFLQRFHLELQVIETYYDDNTWNGVRNKSRFCFYVDQKDILNPLGLNLSQAISSDPMNLEKF